VTARTLRLEVSSTSSMPARTYCCAIAWKRSNSATAAALSSTCSTPWSTSKSARRATSTSSPGCPTGRLPHDSSRIACPTTWSSALERDCGARSVRELSARVFESAKYVLIFTTASRERLDAQRCLDGYRLRWQIELQFKRWKSLCGFDLLPNTRDDTTLAWLYAKVLLGALLDRMASIPTELSPPERHAALVVVAPDVVRPLEAHEHPLAPCCSPRCSRSSCMTPWHGYRTSFVGSAAWNRRDAELSASDSEGVNSSPGAVRR
jgi:hypothetical protein